MPLNIGGVAGGLPPLLPTSPLDGAASKATTGDAPNFGDALKQAIGALGQLGTQADASSLRLAAGNPVDIHEVMLNTEQASLGFQVALQVRNKLVDAYQDIMRMSV